MSVTVSEYPNPPSEIYAYLAEWTPKEWGSGAHGFGRTPEFALRSLSFAMKRLKIRLFDPEKKARGANIQRYVDEVMEWSE